MLFITREKITKYFLSFGIAFLLVLLSSFLALSQIDPNWYEQGLSLYQQGQLTEAIKIWQQGLESSPEEPLKTLAQLNQAQAYLELGNLTKVSQLLEQSSSPLPSNLDAFAQGIAGNLALHQGNYNRAIALYEKLLTSESYEFGNRIILLNNLTQAVRGREKIYLTQAEEDLERRADLLALAEADHNRARELSQEAVSFNQAGNEVLQIRARLNLAVLVPEQVDLMQLRQDILELPASRTQVELLLDLAHLKSEPLATLEKTVQVAQQLGEPKVQSWALGALGHYYEERREYPQALRVTQQAEWAAQKTLDWTQLTQWQWQRARIYQQLGEDQKAITAYRQSIESVQALRKELAGNRIGQSIFLDTIQPLYRGYLEILLAEPGAQDSLKEAIEVLKLQQLAELDNYFGDICQVAPQKGRYGDTGTATIYTVMLSQKTYEIIEFSDDTYLLISLPVPEATLKQSVLSWRVNLTNRFTNNYLIEAQNLYELLIRPLKDLLLAQEITRLVFINDGVLRNIPMGALYDQQEQEFLVEQFSISYALGLGGMLSPLPRPELPLIVGMTQPTPTFATSLPGVSLETQELQSLLGGERLLDGKFTPESLASHLERQDYKLLHLATHSKFTGDIDEAVMQTGVGILSLTNFERLLRARRSPLSHLTLSACETAEGNRYAVLGLAGVGLRSGIGSVLGTLWFADDSKVVEIVLDFYRGWLEGETLDRALQQAQIKQIRRGLSPALWASFVRLQG